jgi:tRNA(Glu) U13 pseudouridine synthase TruD
VGAAAAAHLLAEDGFFAGEAGGSADGGASAEARVAAAFSARDRRFQFAGGYRAIVRAAGDVQWRLLRGVAPHEDVLASDAEILRGGGGGGGGGGFGRGAPRVASGGASGAPTLVVSFTLAKSAYATVALREVMEG